MKFFTNKVRFPTPRMPDTGHVWEKNYNGFSWWYKCVHCGKTLNTLHWTDRKICPKNPPPVEETLQYYDPEKITKKRKKK